MFRTHFYIPVYKMNDFQRQGASRAVILVLFSWPFAIS